MQMPRATRVLITTAAALGHFHPLAAAASALRESGAQVKFACSPSFCRRVVESGFEAIPCGMDWQSQDLSGTWPDFRLVPRHERNAWINSVVWARRLPEAMIPDLIEIIDGWKPSLILSGRAELAGSTVGEVLGVPYATASAGRVIGLKEFITSTRQGRDELRRNLGLGPDPSGSSLYRHLYLNYIPDMFLPKEDFFLPVRHNLRPAFFEDPVDGVPDWLVRLGPRSVIYVTLGSILGEQWSHVFGIVVDAVSCLGHTVIVTVGQGVDTSGIGSRFPGVHVATYIPQRFILERAALVICHGGINTVLGTLSHGVPLLIMPTEQSDQRWNAETCKRLGAGLSIDITDADRVSIREAASTVLTEHSYQRSARDCMAEMLQLPSMERSVELLLRLASDRDPG